MKKYLLIAAAAVSMLAACTKPEDKVVAEVQITTPADVAVGVEGDIITVEFTSNVAWTVESNADWAKVNKASGDAGTGTVKVTVDENKTDDSRQAVITVTAAEATATVKITQAQKNALSLSATTGTASWDAGTVEFTVLANVSFEATSNADWAKVAVGKASESKKVTVSVDKNYGAAREAVITVQGEGLKGTYTLTQAAFEPSFVAEGIEDYTATAKAAGGAITFTIKANMTCNLLDVAEGWLSVAKNGDTYTVTVAANDDYAGRDAYVSFECPDYLVDELDEEGAATGEKVPEVYSIYIYQEGLAYVAWAMELPSLLKDAVDWTTAKNFYSLALVNSDKLFVATGGSQHIYNPANGEYVKAFALADGKVAQSITNDDKGNLIVMVTEAQDFGKVWIYKRKAAEVEDAANQKTHVFFNNPYYGYGMARVCMRGDAYGQGVTTCFQGGAADYGGVTVCCRWNCGGGATSWEQEAGTGTWVSKPYVTTPTDLVGVNIWNSLNSVFYPMGPRTTDGFLYNGYDSDYSIRHYDKDKDQWTSIFQTGSSWAEGYECMDMVEWNGHKVLGFIGRAFFTCWGMPSYLWLLNMDDINNIEVIACLPYTSGKDTYIADNYSTADIVLNVENNNLAAYIIDGEQELFGKYIFPAK